MRIRITESPVRIGVTRLNVRRKPCSASILWRSGSRRIFGRTNKKNPNSAHAANPGTTRSKNSNQSIGARRIAKRAKIEKSGSQEARKPGHEDSRIQELII